ncbi:MAG: hypothetical protein NVSMB24_37610 [Mucilaginibacter sp.]
MKRIYPLLLAGGLFIAGCGKKNDTGSPVIDIIGQNAPSVSTFAGSGTAGTLDGTKEQAQFNGPTGIAIDASGFLFVADKQNNMVRIISPQGVVNTIAGTGASGFANGKDTAKFSFPAGVGVNYRGNLFVADENNSSIRAINTLGVVSTFAGNGSAGLANGTGAAALFNTPTGIIADAKGNVYVADNGNNLIRKITAQGVVTTLAGSGVRGAINGTGIAASFNQPQALAVDSAGNLYIADMGNNLVRKITAQGVVTTLAGSGSAGSANGTGTAASFNGPAGIAVDAIGNVYVGDSNNNLVRKITKDGVVTTLAGSGTAGKANGPLSSATFNGPQGIAVDTYGRLYVADTGNSLIRRITP